GAGLGLAVPVRRPGYRGRSGPCGFLDLSIRPGGAELRRDDVSREARPPRSVPAPFRCHRVVAFGPVWLLADRLREDPLPWVPERVDPSMHGCGTEHRWRRDGGGRAAVAGRA